MRLTSTDWTTDIKLALDETLDTVAHPLLRAAMAYSVDAGGQRLRPLLLLSIVELYDGVVAEALPADTALEFVHTVTLILDDLPAMDNDDLRRGLPTKLQTFGEALAILAGDALLTDAFEFLSQQVPEKGAALVTILAEAAGSTGMVAGQVLDMDGETTTYDSDTRLQMQLE